MTPSKLKPKTWLTRGEAVDLCRDYNLSEKKFRGLCEATDAEGRPQLVTRVFPGCVHRRYLRSSLLTLIQPQEQ